MVVNSAVCVSGVCVCVCLCLSLISHQDHELLRAQHIFLHLVSILLHARYQQGQAGDLPGRVRKRSNVRGQS